MVSCGSLVVILVWQLFLASNTRLTSMSGGLTGAVELASANITTATTTTFDLSSNTNSYIYWYVYTSGGTGSIYEITA